jgi:hypothetical protein
LLEVMKQMSDSSSTSARRCDAAALASFALQLHPTSRQDPETLAVGRGWIGRDGRPTEEGRQVLRDLEEQAGTPSVFRNVA